MIVFFFLTGASFFCAPSPLFLSFFEAFFWAEDPKVARGEDADDEASVSLLTPPPPPRPDPGLIPPEHERETGLEPENEIERCRGSIDSTSVKCGKKYEK